MPRGRSPNREKAFELWKKSRWQAAFAGYCRGAWGLGNDGPQVEKPGRLEKCSVTKRARNVTKPNGQTLPNKPGTLPNKTAGNGNVTKRKTRRQRCAKGQPKRCRPRRAKRQPEPLCAWAVCESDARDDPCRASCERLRQIDYTDEEALIIDEVILSTSRERQLLESIQKYQDAKNGLSLDG